MPIKPEAPVMQIFEALRVLTERTDHTNSDLITPGEFLAGQQLAHLVITAHRTGTMLLLTEALIEADLNLVTYRAEVSA